MLNIVNATMWDNILYGDLISVWGVKLRTKDKMSHVLGGGTDIKEETWAKYNLINKVLTIWMSFSDVGDAKNIFF